MRSAGYTLWEMLIVISILMIGVAIVMVNYKSSMKKTTADLVIMRLYQAAIYARASAIQHHYPVSLCSWDSKTENCGKDWRGQWLIFTDEQRDGILRQPEQVLRHIHDPHFSGTIQWKNFRRKDYLQFLSDGTTDYLNGTFIYCPADKDNRYARAIFVNKNGVCRLSVDADKDGIHEDSSGKPLTC